MALDERSPCWDNGVTPAVNAWRNFAAICLSGSRNMVYYGLRDIRGNSQMNVQMDKKKGCKVANSAIFGFLDE